MFVVGCLLLGVGISQATLLFARDEKPTRAAFLTFWALVIIVICMFSLLCTRMSSSAFRGAVLIARRPGESQAEADARSDKQVWRAAIFLMPFAGLLCYAFIIWQAIERY